MSSSDAPDPKAANKARFELELEFVQSLANPFYLHSLAQQGILNQPAFINFLQYLQYWKEKEYARFIQYVSNVTDAVVGMLNALLDIHMRCIILSYCNIPSSDRKLVRTNGESC